MWSGPAVPQEAAERLKVVAYEESEDTLFIGARHRNGATWVSEPARALLECLKCEDNVPNGDQDAALVVERSSAGPAQVVIELAGSWAGTNRCSGLRRSLPAFTTANG